MEKNKIMDKIRLTRRQLDKLVNYCNDEGLGEFIEELVKLPYNRIEDIHTLSKMMKDLDNWSVNDLLMYMVTEKHCTSNFKYFMLKHPKLDEDLVKRIFDYGNDEKELVNFIADWINSYHIKQMYWGTVFMFSISEYSEEQRRNIVSFIFQLCNPSLKPNYIIPYLFEFDFVEE